MTTTLGSGKSPKVVPQGELNPLQVKLRDNAVEVSRTIQGRYMGRYMGRTVMRRLEAILTPFGNYGQTFRVTRKVDYLTVTSDESVEVLAQKLRLIIDELAILTNVPIQRSLRRTGFAASWEINDQAEAIAVCLLTIQLPEGATYNSDELFLYVERAPTCRFGITTLARLVEWHLALYLNTPYSP